MNSICFLIILLVILLFTGCESKSTSIVIDVNESGVISVDNEVVEISEYLDQIENAEEMSIDLRVSARADNRFVMDVLSDARRVGIVQIYISTVVEN